VGQQNLEKVDSFSVSSGGQDNFFQTMYDSGYLPQDLGVKSIQQGSAADEAGLKMGDVIVSLNTLNLWSFEWLRETLQTIEGETVDLGIWRDGKFKDLTVRPEVKEVRGEQTKLIGVYSNAEFVPMSFVQTESKGFIGSLIMAAPRTWDIIGKTVEGFKKLFTAEVSLKTIGGPIAIGKVASDSFNTSLSYFFQLMALISVNLGIINLLPIPVLDGGHIMFIFLEIINRGPMSRRKMEIAQQVGLSLLLILMFGAIFNDVSRFF
jgi:regulator of sigma E protease